MTSCPKCKNIVEEAFGLTTCTECGENFFAGDTMSDDQFASEEQEDLERDEHDVVGATEEAATEDVFKDQSKFTNNEFEDDSLSDQSTETFPSCDDNEDQNEDNLFSDKNPLIDNVTEDVQENDSSSDIYYDIEIEGIDSPDITEQVLEMLDDPRFNWNISEDSINMGKLVLKNVSSVKAHMVVCYMTGLPVELKWYQV